MLHLRESSSEGRTSVEACSLVSALCFHISLAACSITFNYPPCQPPDSDCLLALVITGFREQVIRSRSRPHPGSLLRPQALWDGRAFPLLSTLKQRYGSSVHNYMVSIKAQTHIGCGSTDTRTVETTDVTNDERPSVLFPLPEASLTTQRLFP